MICEHTHSCKLEKNIEVLHQRSTDVLSIMHFDDWMPHQSAIKINWFLSIILLFAETIVIKQCDFFSHEDILGEKRVLDQTDQEIETHANETYNRFW